MADRSCYHIMLQGSFREQELNKKSAQSFKHWNALAY